MSVLLHRLLLLRYHIWYLEYLIKKQRYIAMQMVVFAVHVTRTYGWLINNALHEYNLRTAVT